MVTTLGSKRKQLSAQNLFRKLRREIIFNFQQIETKFFHDYTPKNKTCQQILLHEVCQPGNKQAEQANRTLKPHNTVSQKFSVCVQALLGGLLSSRPKTVSFHLLFYLSPWIFLSFQELWMKYSWPKATWAFIWLYLVGCCRVGRRPRELLFVFLFVAMKVSVFSRIMNELFVTELLFVFYL